MIHSAKSYYYAMLGRQSVHATECLVEGAIIALDR